ncbi:MAG: LysR family transcriptional regulator [Eubacterium sp.]|nr:LysR family transcriptional regulator [Eubacterium sp.]
MSNSFDYYQIFYYVARYKSFNRAAKVLLNSQPNLTRSINNLEANLGCKLFERSHTGVTLTEAGEIFYEYVSEAHKQVSTGLEALERYKNESTQSISIGLSSGITDYTVRNRILPPIRDFSHANPNIHLRFRNASTPELIQLINDNELDIAVITTTESSDPVLREKILYTFIEIPIAGNAFRDRLYGRKVSIKELVDYPIITLARDTETYAFHDQLFAKYGVMLKPYIESHTMRQTLAFVESDMGIAAIAGEYAQPAIEDGSVFRIDMIEVMPQREISLLRNNRIRTQSVIDLETEIEKYNAKKKGHTKTRAYP